MYWIEICDDVTSRNKTNFLYNSPLGFKLSTWSVHEDHTSCIMSTLISFSFICHFVVPSSAVFFKTKMNQFIFNQLFHLSNLCPRQNTTYPKFFQPDTGNGTLVVTVWSLTVAHVKSLYRVMIVDEHRLISSLLFSMSVQRITRQGCEFAPNPVPGTAI